MICPLYIGVFRAIGIMLGSQGVAHLVEQFFPWRAGWAPGLKASGVWGRHEGFEECIILKIFLINHQVGRNRDIITIFFPINRPTSVSHGRLAADALVGWLVRND